MIKKLISLLLIINCQLLIVNGQSLSPTVFTSSGYYSSGAGVSLSSTMGETFNATLQNGNVILTQGQQQPELDILTGSIVGINLCINNSIAVPYSAMGYYGAANVFTAQLSDAYGSFASPTNIGTLTSQTSSTINATIPNTTVTGASYRIRVVSSAPAYIGKVNSVNLSIARPTPAITGAMTLCAGGATTLDAGTFSSYLWSDNSTLQTLSVSTPGMFAVTVTDVNGCTGSTTVTTTVNANPTPNISGSYAFCAGSSTMLNAGNYSSYNWSSGETIQTISVSTAGTFTVTVTNANGCTASTSATTTVNDNPTPNISGALAFCNGSSTMLDAGAYSSYNWSSGQTAQTISVSTVGTFTVTVTNGSGCNASTSVTIGSNTSAPVVSITGESIICAGSYSTLTASGASTYSWMHDNLSGTTVSVSPASATTYTVTGTSVNGCSATTTFTVNINSLFTVSGVKTNVACKGNSTGTITLSVSGGLNVNYLWNNGSTIANRSNLFAGTYTVTVSDNCKTQVFSFTVTEPTTGMLFTGTSKSPKCYGGTNGTATVAVNGGTGGYTYLWSNSQTNATATGLAGTAYTVTVKDASNCTRSKTFILVAPNPLSITLTPTNPAGVPYNNGNIIAVASGGTPNYVYLWNTTPLKTTAVITGLSAGTYTIKVTDKNSCTATKSATLINTGRSDLSSTQVPLVTVNVLPNPSDGLFNVKAISIAESNAILELMDLTGRVILTEEMPLIAGNNAMMLDAQALPKGIYLLRFSVAEKTQTMRLVIQ